MTFPDTLFVDPSLLSPSIVTTTILPEADAVF
jgi:hypothetical protein